MWVVVGVNEELVVLGPCLVVYEVEKLISMKYTIAVSVRTFDLDDSFRDLQLDVLFETFVTNRKTTTCFGTSVKDLQHMSQTKEVISLSSIYIYIYIYIIIYTRSVRHLLNFATRSAYLCLW